MINEIYLAAAIHCKKVYEKNIDLGTTEFNLETVVISGKTFQFLSIAGTNETEDWFKNLDLTSIHGIKKSAYDAAYEIINSDFFWKPFSYKFPLIVTGHSKAGATAIAFHKLFSSCSNEHQCIAFAPARSLRYWTNRKMENTTIFTDPNDPVSWVGRLNFGHPVCNHIKAENDHFGFDIGDHAIDNWVEFCKRMG